MRDRENLDMKRRIKMSKNNENNETNKDEVEKLLQENKELKERLEKGIGENEKFYAYRIYREARKMFWFSIGIIFIGLIAYGFISVQQISKYAKEKANEYVQNVIIEAKDQAMENFKSQLEQTNLDTIASEVALMLKPKITSMVEEETKAFLESTFEEVQKQLPDSSRVPLVNALEEAYGKERYIVFAASSRDKEVLLSRIRNVTRNIGKEFDKRYKDAYIAEPCPGSPFYRIVLGKDLIYYDAVKIKDQAISDGFPEDTYVARMSNE